MASPGLHSVVTRDGYVSQSPAPHFSVPSDHAMLQQFAEFLENRLQTQSLGLLRRIFADYLLEHEHTLVEFLGLAATIIVISPFDQCSKRRRQRAAALLDMPKRPLNERGCVFFYLGNRVHTRNMGLLKMMFLEFLIHEETLIEQFVARGDAVISVIPVQYSPIAPPVPRMVVAAAPPQRAPERASGPQESSAAAPTPAMAAIPTPPCDAATEMVVEPIEEEEAAVDPPPKSSSPEPVGEASSSPRSPTNSGVSRPELAVPVPQREIAPASSSVQRAVTTEALSKSDDPPEERQEPPLPPTSVESATTTLKRVGRPKKAGTAWMRPVVRPSTGSEVHPAIPAKSELAPVAPVPNEAAPTLDAKPSAVASTLTPEVKPGGGSDAQPPVKRKRGRPRKIKTEDVAAPGSVKTSQKTTAPARTGPTRSRGKRTVRPPQNFAADQAICMRSTKRVKLETLEKDKTAAACND